MWITPFPWIVWRRLPTCDRCEKGNGRGFLLPCFFNLFAVPDTVLLHRRFTLRRARHSSAAQLVSLEFTDSTCECRRLVQFIFVGAVYHNALSNCAALLCRTQRRVAHMCSSTVSDTANRLRKTRKKKSSAVPLFRSGHMSAICARLGSKGKVGVQRGRKTAGCPSFLPSAAGAANPRAPQSAAPR